MNDFLLIHEKTGHFYAYVTKYHAEIRKCNNCAKGQNVIVHVSFELEFVPYRKLVIGCGKPYRPTLSVSVSFSNNINDLITPRPSRYVCCKSVQISDE